MSALSVRHALFVTLLLLLAAACTLQDSELESIPAQPSSTVPTGQALSPEATARNTLPPAPQPAPSVVPPGYPPAGDHARPTPTLTPGSSVAHPVQPHLGLWLSHDVLQDLPQSGPAWEQLLAAANESLPRLRISDQDNMADVWLLARALVAARTGETQYRDEVIAGLQQAMDSLEPPNKTGILAVARNLPPYIIAADLINLPADAEVDATFRAWLRELRDTTFSGNSGAYSLVTCHESRPNNFGTHCGAARVAIARYLGDDADLERAAAVFHGWLGNRDVYDGFTYGRLTWQGDPKNPVGINPPGAVVEGHDVGGALPEEMRRAGQFRWPPKETQYAWEALQGAVVQAELLHRAGYPAWQWQEQALLRAARFLYDIGWEAEGDDEWQVWLLNAAYGAGFPAHTPARPGKNMGWTDWTHGNAPGEQARESDAATVTEKADG
jgi:hypothetical protein